jgi:hypothetical protein
MGLAAKIIQEGAAAPFLHVNGYIILRLAPFELLE